VRAAVDWSKPFETPPLAIRIGPRLLASGDHKQLLHYEKSLARLPLTSMYPWEDEPAPAGVLHTIDARQDFAPPRWQSEGGTLPDVLKARIPFRLPEGWSADYSWTADHRTMLAYLYRTETTASSPPDRASPGITLQKFPTQKLRCRLFDLATKKIVFDGPFEQSLAMGRLPSSQRYPFLLVTETP
jgi:hypothetical protein